MQKALNQRRRSSVMEYEPSLFGQYREQLAAFARTQAEKSKELKEDRKKHVQKPPGGDIKSRLKKILEIGGDWVLLTVLGVSIASLSFVMDIIIHFFFDVRDWMQHEITDIFIFKYFLWILFTVSMILLVAIIVRYGSPQAAGSGVSEMKCILRGVILKEYLSARTLVTKCIGLPISLGSGLPLGKEGPFVHISAMYANLMIRVFGSISNELEYESRFLEVIAVACGVGVASTFAAPVGGVLYSIEIVSVFFSVRSYWQGFFASTLGAFFWRVSLVWFNFEENITHIFKTDFRKEYPYETLEIISFALLGVLCGLSAFAFVTLQRNFVLFNRKTSPYHTLLKKYPLLYPIIVSTIIALISFPGTFGQFYGSWLSSEESMHELFSNYSWGIIEDDIDKDEVIDNWRTAYTNIFANTFLFYVMNLIIIAFASTMPIPLGLIVPSFKIGAGLGRFYGECMAYIFPRGMNPYYDRSDFPIIAGAYAVAGSAAFAGANTGALSSAVIAFEMTGQLTHLLPILISVIVANMVAQQLGPSIYDSIIKLKNLPYLPPIIQASSGAHRIFVQDFMEREILYVWEGCSYRYLRHLINAKKQLNMYPYVKSQNSMILLGTIERSELQNLIDNHLNDDKMKDVLTPPSSPPSSPPPSNPSCPIHGTQRSQVPTIKEDEVLEITSVGKHAWEESQLDQVVDFSKCPIEPSPFQLVEGTSLMKAHNMFSLLGLQLSYVTALGRLIGVVALKEIRSAIEQMNSGKLPKRKSVAAEEEPLKKV